MRNDVRQEPQDAEAPPLLVELLIVSEPFQRVEDVGDERDVGRRRLGPPAARDTRSPLPGKGQPCHSVVGVSSECSLHG